MKSIRDRRDLFKCICFDDVLIVPEYSTFKSRGDSDLTPVRLSSDKRVTLSSWDTPFIPAPMDTVAGPLLSKAASKINAPFVGHRRQSPDDQLSSLESHQTKIVSVGTKSKDLDLIISAYSHVDGFLIDIAHGDSISGYETVQHIRNLYGHSKAIILGSIATMQGAMRAITWGVDAIRVGIGGGAACTTRGVTGVGIPTLQSVLWASEARDIMTKEYNRPYVSIIADGGIQSPGDAAKSFVAGADYVMMGSVFAATLEAPGDTIYREEPGNLIHSYKTYRGMASKEANPESSFVEGSAGLVELSGSYQDVIDRYGNGVRSTMSYTNSKCLQDLQEAQLVLVSTSSLKESNTRLK